MNNPYYLIPYEVRQKLFPSYWLDEFKHARQRVSRGWSDRDTWGGGEYILEVVSGVLRKLSDEKSHVDWEFYFKNNYPKTCGYKNLAEVANDIDFYLAFEDINWQDTLDFPLKHSWKELPNGHHEYVNDNSPAENKLIKKAIDEHHREWKRRYKKASNALKFVSINFPQLWD